MKGRKEREKEIEKEQQDKEIIIGFKFIWSTFEELH